MGTKVVSGGYEVLVLFYQLLYHFEFGITLFEPVKIGETVERRWKQ